VAFVIFRFRKEMDDVTLEKRYVLTDYPTWRCGRDIIYMLQHHKAGFYLNHMPKGMAPLQFASVQSHSKVYYNCFKRKLGTPGLDPAADFDTFLDLVLQESTYKVYRLEDLLLGKTCDITGRKPLLPGELSYILHEHDHFSDYVFNLHNHKYSIDHIFRDSEMLGFFNIM